MSLFARTLFAGRHDSSSPRPLTESYPTSLHVLDSIVDFSTKVHATARVGLGRIAPHDCPGVLEP